MNRTIVLDNPEEQFSDRLEWAVEQREGAAADGVTVDVAYFDAYEEAIQNHVEALQDGLAEEDLFETRDIAQKKCERIEEPVEEDMEHFAERDAAKRVLERCFGAGPVETGRVVRSGLVDGGVRLVGENEAEVRVTLEGEADALSIVDTFLRAAGYDISDIE